MRSPQSLLAAAVVGAVAGTYASLWEMHRDSIYQGFSAACFSGSVAVGAIAAMGFEYVLQLALPESAAVILLLGLAYATERGVHESWKAVVPTRDRSDFFATTFSIGSVRVPSRIARVARGTVFVMAVGLFLSALAEVDRRASGPPTFAGSALAGLVAGLIVAAGGAWKNAPNEGFLIRKFIRSPSIAIPFALVLSVLAPSYLCVAVAATGYERAVVETWKILCAHIASRFRDGPWA